MEDIDLVSRMIAKVCHDMATPLNAMGLTMELMADGTPAAVKEDLVFLRQSHMVLTKKLQLLRTLADAAAQPPSSLEQVYRAVAPLAESAGIQWQSTPEGLTPLSSAFNPILLGIAMMITESIARGGIMKGLSNKEHAGFRLNAPGARLKDVYRQYLENPVLAGTSGRIGLIAYVAALCRRQECSLSYVEDPDGFAVFVV